MATVHHHPNELSADAFQQRVAWVIDQARRVGIWHTRLIVRDHPYRRTLRHWRPPVTDPDGTPIVHIPREGRPPGPVMAEIRCAVVRFAEGLTAEQRMVRGRALRRLTERTPDPPVC